MHTHTPNRPVCNEMDTMEYSKILSWEFYDLTGIFEKFPSRMETKVVSPQPHFCH